MTAIWIIVDRYRSHLSGPWRSSNEYGRMWLPHANDRTVKRASVQFLCQAERQPRRKPYNRESQRRNGANASDDILMNLLPNNNAFS